MDLLRCLLILLTTTVNLISSIPTNSRNNIRPSNLERYIAPTVKTDQYSSTQYIIEKREIYEKGFWVNMENEMNKSVIYMPEFSSMLVQLPFDFEVYGHNVREVEVLREGGIKSADPDLQWDATPLRINTIDDFTPSQIRFSFEGGSLTIQWEFRYHYCINETELSFQLKIYDDGRIDFLYKKLPFGNLKNAPFPDIANNFGVSYKFKVPGTNDTFTLGPQLIVNETDITENTIIFFGPLPLCTNFLDRNSCITVGNFRPPLLPCFWCPAIGICSSTEDFLKEVWNDNGCEPRHSPGRGKYDQEHSSKRRDISTINILLNIAMMIIAQLPLRLS